MVAIEEIERKLLALPLKDRVFLVESLLESVAPVHDDMTEAEEIAEAKHRDEEIESGLVKPLTDDEFWRAVESDLK